MNAFKGNAGKNAAECSKPVANWGEVGRQISLMSLKSPSFAILCINPHCGGSGADLPWIAQSANLQLLLTILNVCNFAGSEIDLNVNRASSSPVSGCHIVKQESFKRWN